MALMYVLKIESNTSTCTSFKQEDVIMGKESLVPKYLYLKCKGSGLSSSVGGSSIYGFVGGVSRFSRSRDNFVR